MHYVKIKKLILFHRAIHSNLMFNPDASRSRSTSSTYLSTKMPAAVCFRRVLLSPQVISTDGVIESSNQSYGDYCSALQQDNSSFQFRESRSSFWISVNDFEMFPDDSAFSIRPDYLLSVRPLWIVDVASLA
jgi:hypothetical protein